MPDNTLIAAEVISAFVSHNSVPANELPGLIHAVVGAFDNLGMTLIGQKVAAAKPVPAVAVKKSIHHDYLISLEDGKKYQTLKRHLAGLGMTPDEYRSKWGLQSDYPMVTRKYSERRSEISKAFGLGKKKTMQPVEASAAAKKPPAGKKERVKAEAPVVASNDVQERVEAAQAAA